MTSLLAAIVHLNLSLPQRTYVQVYISSDAAYIAGIVVLALSDGYLKTLALMFGPKTMDPAHQDAAASLLVAVLGISFAAGSLLSTPVVKAL